MLSNILWVALGGAVGSVVRLTAGLLVSHRLPWATLAVNVAGSLLIGILVRRVDHGAALYYFAVVGLCGGFTTFSTFSLETLNLLRQGQLAHALGYAVLSLTLCVAAVYLGMKIKI